LNDALVVVGMGYVGLPVAVSFGRFRRVIGFDIAQMRISELQNGTDRTGEVSESELAATSQLRFTSNPADLNQASTFIICVPTPIDSNNQPDLSPLIQATWDVGRILTPGALVVYESTVYPGVTDDVCIPILEQASGLTLNSDFWVGYSPERINPGDHTRRFEDIVKVVSGSSEHALDLVDTLYRSAIKAETHRAPSIKVAEAAKVIENTQRDLNIALINELSRIFDRLDIDTHEVLQAAGTKWNFLPFSPGLVGGHCIGVDPYYLTYRAQEVGYFPEVILAGRTINDSMGRYVAERVYKLVAGRSSGLPAQWKVLVLGATFKENCPDTRNSRVVDLIHGLHELSAEVTLVDPWVENGDRATIADAHWGHLSEVFPANGNPAPELFDAVVLAVAHDEFIGLGTDIRKLLRPEGVVFDVKGILPKELVEGRL